MTNKPTPEWAKVFDDMWHSFDGYAIYGKDGLMVVDENGNYFEAMKAFISQQLTAFSKEVEKKVIDCEIEHVYDDFVEEKLREQQRQALSNLKQKWGIE